MVTNPEPGSGHPFLSFLNTVTDDGKTRRLNSFQNGVVLVRQLSDEGFNPPAEPISPVALRSLLGLRESAYSALSAIAAGRQPGREDALFLESAMKSTLQEAEFRIRPDGLKILPGPVGRLYDQLVLSLEDLLRGEDFGRLRECARCTHLFLDRGRGRGRRWCAMSRCGNRAKAEGFRARQRLAG